MWFVKWVLSLALKIGFVILIFYACVFAFWYSLIRELDEYSANRPKTSIEQTQKNLPIYLEKINEILKAHDMPTEDFKILNEKNMEGRIEFDDVDIYMSISNDSDREEIYISFRKYYKNVKRLEDLVSPTTDEYSVICEIMQSITGKQSYRLTAENIEYYLEREIFYKGNLREKQEEFENGESFIIEAYDEIMEYGSLRLYLHEFLTDYNSEEKNVELSIQYNMTLDNNEE